jgi:endonuclease/exonuclease/phosphatase (EEP) superfamily protein YafD
MRGFAAGMAAAVAGLCALLALLGAAGQVPLFDFLNHFLPPLLAGGLLATLAGALCARPRVRYRWWLAAAGFIILGALRLGPEIQARLYQPHDDRPGLRIVEINLFKDNSAPAATAQWILDQHPDIILIEEAAKSGAEVREALSADYPYQVSCLKRMRCSTVIMSRYRPKMAGGLARGDPENRKAVSAAWAVFESPRGDVPVIAVHMQRPWPFGDQEFAREKIAELLALQPQAVRELAIVGGDFNLTPWTSAMQRQDQMFGLARLTRARPTWPASFPFLPIDHIYAGAGWRLGRITTGPRLGSDHLPLSVTLEPSDRWRPPAGVNAATPPDRTGGGASR